MLFGTRKNLAKNNDHGLEIKLKEELVYYVTSYSYLGILLDQTLCLGDHFNKTYNKASGRIRLLGKMRQRILRLKFTIQW